MIDIYPAFSAVWQPNICFNTELRFNLERDLGYQNPIPPLPLRASRPRDTCEYDVIILERKVGCSLDFWLS